MEQKSCSGVRGVLGYFRYDPKERIGNNKPVAGLGLYKTLSISNENNRENNGGDRGKKISMIDLGSLTEESYTFQV